MIRQTVIGEYKFLRLLNDKLADLWLPSNEKSDIDSFEAATSLKKELMRTKLEKRRVKIQKLLNLGNGQLGSAMDTTCTCRPPKQEKKKKTKNKSKKNETNFGRCIEDVSPVMNRVPKSPAHGTSNNFQGQNEQSLL